MDSEASVLSKNLGPGEEQPWLLLRPQGRAGCMRSESALPAT